MKRCCRALSFLEGREFLMYLWSTRWYVHSNLGFSEPTVLRLYTGRAITSEKSLRGVMEILQRAVKF